MWYLVDMKSRRLILDASTAILLSKIDLLRVITDGRPALMCETAIQEATARDCPDAREIRALLAEGRIAPHPRPDGVEELMRMFRIDRGEAETIAAAGSAGAICATDDGPAIRCCRALGVAFTSAIGLLGALSEASRVDTRLALELLAKLERFGRYDSRIIEDVARRIRSAGGEA
jgi:predicted nucleic acid-binding protein